jgi:hypothetical protein
MIASDLKKALISQGFEVYRTLGDRIVLAERVRDNLIMDSGVAAVTGAQLGVRFVIRAQGSDFAGETADQLFERARAMTAGVDAGYVECESHVVAVTDPGDRSRTLDTWYEVAFQKTVASAEELYQELRFALGLEKTVPRSARS